ncbi:MAG: hypothetical protein LKI27_10720 [Actinomyces sp.]|nr:hypothetical protein [Actinomyces sp.]MCI1663346.1 hypothetical protein [Actinomyces sp.]
MRHEAQAGRRRAPSGPDTGLNGVGDELSAVPGADFHHGAVRMRLDRERGREQLGGDPCVVQSGHDRRDDLMFAWGERGKAGDHVRVHEVRPLADVARALPRAPGAPADPESLREKANAIGWDIRRLKGATSAGIGQCIARIARAVGRDEMSVIPVSSFISPGEGWDGVGAEAGVAVSVPCVVGAAGVIRRIPVHLDDWEPECFRSSVEAARATVAHIAPGS